MRRNAGEQLDHEHLVPPLAKLPTDLRQSSALMIPGLAEQRDARDVRDIDDGNQRVQGSPASGDFKRLDESSRHTTALRRWMNVHAHLRGKAITVASTESREGPPSDYRATIVVRSGDEYRMAATSMIVEPLAT